MLHSVDYDYDLIFTVLSRHHQEFGTSVAISGRTIAVGSPYADYDKLGSDRIEIDWMTEGTDIKGFSRGKVYVYTSEPSIQNITLLSTHQLSSGFFILQFTHRNLTANTSLLSYNISSEELRRALEELPNIDLISVTQEEGTVDDHVTGRDGFYYSWAITFLSEWDPSLPLLLPLWNSTDCHACGRFDTITLPNGTGASPPSRIEVRQVHAYEEWLPSQSLSAHDKRRGDRFGSCVALDHNTLVISAIHSSAVVTTTWDFEIGKLQGWHVSGGTAFQFQPTYGDNSLYHAMYSHHNPIQDPTVTFRIRSSQMRGRYYVNTYERRPGNPLDYRAADAVYPQGSIQGDGPVGMMESEVFLILGNEISFLIGGGCDPLVEYVELFVDGMSVARHTGRCSVQMRRVVFDVSLYHGRSCYLRVVDAGKGGMWDHISVDDFQFDWDVKGGLVNDTNTQTHTQTETQTQAQLFGGHVETSRSGAVYVFNRRSLVSQSERESERERSGERYCTAEMLQSSCQWVEVNKLTPSDKRSGDEFGSSLSVNEESGIIIVSSPFTSLTGFYRETPSLYPYRTPVPDGVMVPDQQLEWVQGQGQGGQGLGETESDIAGLQFPLDSSLETYFYHQYTLTPESSASDGVMFWRNAHHVFPSLRGNEQVGAIYVYTIQRGQVDHQQLIYQEDSWKITEHCKIQSSDAFSRDFYGSSVSLSGSLLATGAKGQDGYQPNQGAIYLYHIAAATVRFEKVFLSLPSPLPSTKPTHLSPLTSLHSPHLTIGYVCNW
jgi:hypothetical protein